MKPSTDSITGWRACCEASRTRRPASPWHRHDFATHPRSPDSTALREGLSDPRVLEVIRRTPRHLFVDEALSHRAYEDTALPIGHNQTISQPFMVARMSELLLADGPLDKVLEIGTGSGYQTAVLAQLVERVFSVERIQALQDRAKERLVELKLRNVVFRWGDGWEGWPALAPYNGIIVTAAAADVPQALLDQLAPGGRLVIPVGVGEVQQLMLIIREEDGFPGTCWTPCASCRCSMDL